MSAQNFRELPVLQPAAKRKALSPAAQRALDEAEARRKAGTEAGQAAPAEINGRKGPEPVRYGDWENKGLAYDF